MELETRACACGCGKTWRTAPTSLVHFFARAHAKEALTGSCGEEAKRKAQEYFSGNKMLVNKWFGVKVTRDAQPRGGDDGDEPGDLRDLVGFNSEPGD